MDAGREQSDFNMAVSYLNRLNLLLLQCDDAALKLDGYTWFHTLAALFRELSTRMKQNEKDSFNNLIRKLAKDIDNITKMNDKRGSTGIPTTLYMELHGLEIELRNVLKEAGLETRMVNEEAKLLR